MSFTKVGFTLIFFIYCLMLEPVVPSDNSAPIRHRVLQIESLSNLKGGNTFTTLDIPNVWPLARFPFNLNQLKTN